MSNYFFKTDRTTRISIASIFRNNESYLVNHYIPNMVELEKFGMNISFFFYTNDNIDNTELVLREFCNSRRNAKLKVSTINAKTFHRDTSLDRIQNITSARNNLLKLRPFPGEFTVFIDSDIYFDIKVIIQLIKNLKSNYGALFPNGIDKNYYNETNNLHYYDVLAFIDTFDNYGFEGFIEEGHKENPFFTNKDKTSWERGKITNVKSAFGGIGIYRNIIINNFSNYECLNTRKVLQNKRNLYNEHWSLNFFVSCISELGVDPQTKIYHYDS